MLFCAHAKMFLHSECVHFGFDVLVFCSGKFVLPIVVSVQACGTNRFNLYKACISRLSGEAFLRTEGLEVAFTRFQGVMCLKISARNRLKGKVVSVEKDGLMAKVKIEVSVPAYVTAVITRDATEDLSLKVGDQVEAVIKSTEVMIAK